MRNGPAGDRCAESSLNGREGGPGGGFQKKIPKIQNRPLSTRAVDARAVRAEASAEGVGASAPRRLVVTLSRRRCRVSALAWSASSCLRVDVASGATFLWTRPCRPVGAEGVGLRQKSRREGKIYFRRPRRSDASVIHLHEPFRPHPPTRLLSARRLSDADVWSGPAFVLGRVSGKK